MYGSCVLYSKTSKQIGSASLSRADDDDESNQIVKIKNKEVWFQEGFTVVIGNKLVEVKITIKIKIINFYFYFFVFLFFYFFIYLFFYFFIFLFCNFFYFI